MKYYLKTGYKATLKGFKTGDFTEADNIHQHNNDILTGLYNKLISGEISTFYQRTKDHLIIAHLSTREGVQVQVSHNWIKDGQIIPCSHDNINSPEELIKEHPFYTGEYIREFIA